MGSNQKPSLKPLDCFVYGIFHSGNNNVIVGYNKELYCSFATEYKAMPVAVGMDAIGCCLCMCFKIWAYIERLIGHMLSTREATF